MKEDKLSEHIRDQLNAIPSLNEYFNRLPCKTKDWIIEAVKQAFKDWLTDKRLELQEPEYNPSTYQGSYAMLGKEQMLDELIQFTSNKEVEKHE